MHVCHFITSLERGGAQSLVRDIVAHDNSSWEHSVCHFGNDMAIEGEIRDAGADVVRVGESSYVDIPRIFANLRRYLSKSEVDVLHTHLIHATVLGRIAGQLAGVEGIVSTIHNVRRNFTKLERTSERVTRPIDSVTVAVSEAVRESFDGESGWVTIPNGIPTKEFHAQVESADPSILPQMARGEEPTFLNVARYVPEKNQAVLIRAMDRVVEDIPDATLLIVGRGPEEDRLRSLVVEHDLEDSVVVTGEVPEIHPYFASADWFVLPSEHEGLPITILEALAAGVPVIAADLPSLEGVVEDGENGFLVDALTPRSLAEVMISTLSNYSMMSAAAIQKARSEFDISVMIDAYERRYRRICR